MACFLCGNVEGPSLHKASRPCQASDGGLCSVCQKIRKLESKITQVQALLADLVEQHRNLRTEMNHAHNPVVLQVPPEIASTIFKFCVPSIPSVPFINFRLRPQSLKEDIRAPLVLGAVCKGWRNIAWSEPELWTYIDAWLDSPHEIELSIILDWLTRSGALPLSVHVRTTDNYLSTLSSHATSLVDIINQQSDRWEVLDLRIPGPFIGKFAGNGSSDAEKRSILRSLILHSHSSTLDERGKFSMDNVIPEPINVWLYDRPLESVSITWTNVTRVDAGYLEVNECFELLIQAKNLKYCRLSDIEYSAEQYPPLAGTTLTHTVLLELEVTFRGFSAGEEIIRNLTLPALKKLHIDMIEEIIPADAVISLFRRSSCRLKELFIEQGDVENDALLSLLREMPSLEQLTVSPHPWAGFSTERFLTILAQSPNLEENGNADQSEDSNLLPNLHSLRCFGAWIKEWHHIPPIFGPLSELQNPRRRPLNSVHIDLKEPPGGIIERAVAISLLSYLEAGLDLKITYMKDKLDLIQIAKDQYHTADGEVLGELA